MGHLLGKGVFVAAKGLSFGSVDTSKATTTGSGVEFAKIAEIPNIQIPCFYQTNTSKNKNINLTMKIFANLLTCSSPYFLDGRYPTTVSCAIDTSLMVFLSTILIKVSMSRIPMAWRMPGLDKDTVGGYVSKYDTQQMGKLKR